jgi:arylsulfatase A-like enzyme
MAQPPNIVFLFPDQLRRDFLSCYEAGFIDTPNIDWIAEDDVRDVRAHYAGLVKQIDHEVGEIIDTLRRNDLVDNTAIVLATDHGDHLGDHGIEGKATFYESAAHIPLLVRAPGGEEASTRSDLVELRDVTSTMLALAGCDLPAYMDSQPLPGLGLDGPPPRSHVFGTLVGAWMAFDGRYKLSKYSSGEAMLFDLDNDPQEQNNLIDDPAHAGAYRSLDAALTLELMRSMSFAMHDRMPSPQSMTHDELMGLEGWTWRFPSPADAIQGQEFYL